MKKTVKFYTIISLFLFLSFSMPFSNYQFNSKVYADKNDAVSDDAEDLKKPSNSIKDSPIESKLQPVLYTPQVIQTQVLESLPKIEVSIPTIPSNDQIKQIIDNVKDLNGVVSSINLEETANGLLKGEVITKQKILGLIDIQIPYKVTLDSISGTIKEKFPQGIWNSFLDFISF